MKYFISLILLVAFYTLTAQNSHVEKNKEPYRPKVHFTPQAHWMNDPNGLVYFHRTYHLFYQYYPGASVWGPMHWGHATSSDLVHWHHKPIALYPDSLGYIFSGSAVVDSNNTSGFGGDGKIPLIAIFTHHDPAGEKAGRNDYQNQSMAYSLDEGNTWIKYFANPVLRNPGIKDFRDPKISWYEPDKKWIMTLATLDRISFYSSKNLKTWIKESEFGNKVGAHGGVWECPDLFPLDYAGKQVWILLVSINPGGPNSGSATQYFTGHFDGKSFTPYQTDTRWIDFGPDDYAGVTWSNTGHRKIFLGWMSNWNYGKAVPTETWRSAMTVPRDLGLEKIADKFFLTSTPAKEFNSLKGKSISITDVDAHHFNLSAKVGRPTGPVMIKLNSNNLESFSITCSNKGGNKMIIGYDKAQNYYFIDRSQSGNIGFESSFGSRYQAPRISTENKFDMTLILDNTSIELFADKGLSVMTAIFFPESPLTDIGISAPGHFKITSFTYTALKKGN